MFPVSIVKKEPPITGGGRPNTVYVINLLEKILALQFELRQIFCLHESCIRRKTAQGSKNLFTVERMWWGLHKQDTIIPGGCSALSL